MDDYALISILFFITISFLIPFCLDTKREKKVKAALISRRKLLNTALPYPNSQTAFAEAELPMPELKHGCGYASFLLVFYEKLIWPSALSQLRQYFKAFSF
jgi:hypothetical protein